MENDVIIVNNITKAFSPDRGNFDVSFSIKKGECVGILGENGAGKTTLIRQMMGFIKPNSGNILIEGFDAYKDTEKVKELVSYVPGEINYPDLRSGKAFLKIMKKMDPYFNGEKANSIIKSLQLDITAYPKRMSKGMKQKLALVNALGKDKDILILDEPTIGLDPLMRDHLLELLLKEKEAGKTIFFSSNTFLEMEKTCDRVVFLSKGRIIDIADMNLLEHGTRKVIKAKFMSRTDFDKFIEKDYTYRMKDETELIVEILVGKEEINKVLQDFSNFNLRYLRENNYGLELYFKDLMEERINGKD